MKKLFVFICIVCLLGGCAPVDTPPVQGGGSSGNSAVQPEGPTLPDTPAGPDVPAVPDKPVEPDVPVVPDTPDVPVVPEVPAPPAPVYPDISGFETKDKTIVYSVSAVELVRPDGENLTFDGGITFISVGMTDTWHVILHNGDLYLADGQHITNDKPQAALDKQAQLGGTFYPGTKELVAIDPGHQGKGMSEKEPNAPGSDIMKAKVASGTQGVATGIEEYKLNLNVSLLLRDELISRGYSVVMIREDHDARISNAERAVMANEYGADAFVRVHANGSENPDARGAIAIFQTKNNPWCGDLYGQSRMLSETVLSHYCEASGIENDGNWETDTMTGINWTRIPSTILELGYMSNAEEDKLMATPEFHANAASGIAQGLDAYFDKIKE